MMSFRRFSLISSLVIILSLSFILPAQPAAAQQLTSIAEMQIQLWPEYDRAEMLVQYSGKITNASGQVDLTFTLPKTGKLLVTAYVDATSGSLVAAANTLNGDKVTMTSPNVTFH